MRTLHEHEAAGAVLPASATQTQPEEQAQAQAQVTLPQMTSKHISHNRLLRRRKRVVQAGQVLFLKAIGLGSIGLAIMCAAFVVEFLFLAVWWYSHPSHDDVANVAGWLAALRMSMILLPICGVAYLLQKVGRKVSKRAILLQEVLISSANTKDLLARESLVRACEQPFLFQQDVLLRPATGTQEGQEEQLLRASAGE